MKPFIIRHMCFILMSIIVDDEPAFPPVHLSVPILTSSGTSAPRR